MTSLQLGNSWLSTLLRICFQLPCPANLIMGNDQFEKEGLGEILDTTLAHNNFYAPILGFGLLGWSRYQRVPRAASNRANEARLQTSLNQHVAHGLRSFQRQAVVVRLGPNAISMSGDLHLDGLSFGNLR